MKEWLQFTLLPVIVGTFCLGFPFVFTFLLDWWLKPEIHSIQDEGIYFGMLIMGVAAELALFSILSGIVQLIYWIKSKLKLKNK